MILIAIVTFLPKKNTGEIKIGALYALSGPVSIYGEVSIQGVRDAVKYFEENSDLNFSLVEEDTVGDAKKGVVGAQRLFSVDGVRYAVVGLSAVSAAVAPVTDDYDVVTITDATVMGMTKDHDNLFQNFVPAFKKSASYLKNVGVKKLAIVYTNDEFGGKWNTEVTNSVKDSIEVNSFAVARDATDFATEASKIKQFNPDRIFVIAFGPSLKQIYRDMENIGISQEKYITYLSCSFPGVLADNSLEGALSYEFPPVGNKKLKLWMENNNGNKSTFYTSAFENTLSLLTAIEKVGNNPEKVREYLKTASMDGVYGTVEFGDDRTVDRDLTLTKIEDNKCVAL